MPAYLTPDNLRLAMGLSFFVMGLASCTPGLFMLIFGPYRKEAKALAAQSARLNALKSSVDPKGLMDGIALATQSATALIEAVNKLILTSSGTAIVLIVIGAVFEYAAYYLLIAGR